MKKGRTCKTDLGVIQDALNFREESKMGWAEVARKFGCSEQTLYYYRRKQRQNSLNEKSRQTVPDRIEGEDLLR
jgi:transposase-like protein